MIMPTAVEKYMFCGNEVIFFGKFKFDLVVIM